MQYSSKGPANLSYSLRFEVHSNGRQYQFCAKLSSQRRARTFKTRAAVRSGGAFKSIAPKRGYSQNFLVDHSVSREIASEAGLEAGDTVFEIGPGTGSLTDQLLAFNVTVVAIEADPRLQTYLTEKYQQEIRAGRFQLISGDVTRIDLQLIFGTDASRRQKQKVVANLPFNITTDVLKLLLPQGNVISEVFVMLQLEAAQRLSGETPGNSDFRAMSVVVDYYSQAQASLQIGRQSFEPQPNVDCQMVRFMLRAPKERLSVPSEQGFLRLVNICFGSRRKTLRNNLKSVFPQEAVDNAISQLRLSDTIRPQELTVDDFAALATILCP